MKRLLPGFPLLLIAGVLAGCRGEPAVAADLGRPAGTREQPRWDDEAAEATRILRTLAFAERRAFMGQMRAELGHIQGELDELSLRAERCSGAERTDARATAMTARGRWVLAMNDLDLVGGATRATWDDRRGGFRRSYGALQLALAVTQREPCASRAP